MAKSTRWYNVAAYVIQVCNK